MSALLVSADNEHRRAWSASLSGVGIGNFLEAVRPQEAVARGQVASEHGVCLLEAAPQENQVLHTIRALKRQGWDRLVLVTPRGDSKTVRLALASRIRSLVVAAKPKPDLTRIASRRVDGAADLHLSDRELQVVQLVANGHTNRSVGEELSLSPLTVKSHLSRIGRKLGTGDRAQIVATCMRTGLIG